MQEHTFTEVLFIFVSSLTMSDTNLAFIYYYLLIIEKHSTAWILMLRL